MLAIKVRILVYLRYKVKNAKLLRYLEKRIAALSGGYYYSQVIRNIYKDLHGLEIGYGTYGGCWNNASMWWNNIKIGRYCSFAGQVSLFPCNHPMNLFTTHPITYDTYCSGASKQRKFVNEPSLNI